MSTVTLDIPPNTLQVVLNVHGYDNEQLRRELLAAEDRNKDLSDQIERIKAEYEIKLAEARVALERQRGAAVGRHSASNFLLSGAIAICSDKSPNRYLKTAKSMTFLHMGTSASSRLNVVVFRNEFVWEDFPETVYCVKPTRRRMKNGNWTDCNHAKMLRARSEFVARVSGTWHYMGTYENVTSSDVSLEEYSALPFETREELIRQTGYKRYRQEIRAMYTRGLKASKFRFKRVGFNVQFQQCLLAVVEDHARDAAEEVGNRPVAETHAAEDSDDSDASE